MTTRWLAAALLPLLLSFAAPVQSQQSLEQQLTTEKSRAAARLGPTYTTCPSVPVTLPATLSGTIGYNTCTDPLGVREHVYAITVSKGETVTFTFRSVDFEVFLYMYLNNGTSMETTRVSNKLTSGVSLVTARHTFVSGGTYLVEAGALFSDSATLPWRGDYTLTMTTSKVTSGSCSPTATSVCLLNNRFRVSISYYNPITKQAGSFAAGRLLQGSQNPDTGLFGFSSPQAVEVVVRVQDTRPFANRFDIYYGGMTDFPYTVTVTDTQTGTVREYPFAGGTPGGGVDRTSFQAN